jgi:hypothetical protein
MNSTFPVINYKFLSFSGCLLNINWNYDCFFISINLSNIVFMCYSYLVSYVILFSIFKIVASFFFIWHWAAYYFLLRISNSFVFQFKSFILLFICYEILLFSYFCFSHYCFSLPHYSSNLSHYCFRLLHYFFSFSFYCFNWVLVAL